MKIAAISDIHGNIAALDAVLADIRERGVDMIVNLGDIVSGGLFPCETADRLISLELPTIGGNHERQLLNFGQDRLGPSDRHALAELRADQFAWLAGLPTTLRVVDEVLMVHGTPASDLDYFMETVTEDGLRPATDTEIAERAKGTDASVILCGHTHLQRIARLEDGTLIVNPGSVGLPAFDDEHPYPHRVEAGSPHARYGVLTLADGTWSAELLAVEYDWEKAARQAKAHGRVDWEKALRTGRI